MWVLLLQNVLEAVLKTLNPLELAFIPFTNSIMTPDPTSYFELPPARSNISAEPHSLYLSPS